MARYTTRTISEAAPDRVLQVLTDPDAIRDWSPVPFELDELRDRRLRSGSQARVSGSLAGLRVGFDVQVHAADERRLALTAQGPIKLDVSYELTPRAGGSEVTASVDLSGGGITGRLIAKATEGLLRAGALDMAAGRVAAAASA
jgi:hypothetical protein